MTDTARLTAALTGRYTIERELGVGGMATVYLARDLKHDREVALKVLRPELAHALGPDRFLREIRTTARLDHPHILPVLDSGEAGGLLWYTMPYVKGESLRDRMRRETQLPLATALDIAREVASALDYAHRAGVVHRDIKPENILLADGQARVADFGIARALDAGSGGKVTATGIAVGTPAYMSPEQASADPVDGRSDVYALGCVLYEMLAGEPPYTGPTAQAIVAKRLRDPVPSVRRVREELPEKLDTAIRTALAKTPADRFASAAAFAQALVEPVPVPHRRLKRFAILGTLGAVLAIVVGLSLMRLAQRSGSDAKRVMVAVLANRTGNPALDPVGLTAADYINRGLFRPDSSRWWISVCSTSKGLPLQGVRPSHARWRGGTGPASWLPGAMTSPAIAWSSRPPSSTCAPAACSRHSSRCEGRWPGGNWRSRHCDNG